MPDDNIRLCPLKAMLDYLPVVEDGSHPSQWTREDAVARYEAGRFRAHACDRELCEWWYEGRCAAPALAKLLGKLVQVAHV